MYKLIVLLLSLGAFCNAKPQYAYGMSGNQGGFQQAPGGSYPMGPPNYPQPAVGGSQLGCADQLNTQSGFPSNAAGGYANYPAIPGSAANQAIPQNPSMPQVGVQTGGFGTPNQMQMPYQQQFQLQQQQQEQQFLLAYPNDMRGYYDAPDVLPVIWYPNYEYEAPVEQPISHMPMSIYYPVVPEPVVYPMVYLYPRALSAELPDVVAYSEKPEDILYERTESQVTAPEMSPLTTETFVNQLPPDFAEIPADPQTLLTDADPQMSSSSLENFGGPSTTDDEFAGVTDPQISSVDVEATSFLTEDRDPPILHDTMEMSAPDTTTASFDDLITTPVTDASSHSTTYHDSQDSDTAHDSEAVDHGYLEVEDMM